MEKQQIPKLDESKIEQLKKSSENPKTTQNEEITSRFIFNNKNENTENEVKTYKKRKGTDDHGKEYEFLICAYYALKLCFNQKVTNFEITTNNEIYLDLDDVALKVTFLDGSSHTFLIQLKHTEQEKGITDSMLSNKKGDFGLLKYFESFQKLQICDNTSCILFTNRKSQLKVKSEFELENHIIAVNKAQTDNNKHLLMLIDTVSDDEATHIFNFEQTGNNFEDFFKCFYFFTNQRNCRKIRAHIDKLLNEKFGCHVDFINFMRQWWKGTFVFTKHDTIAKLAELVLSPFVQEIPRNLTHESLSIKTKLLKSAIMQFEMTVVKEFDASAVAKLWIEESDDNLEDISKIALKYGLATKGLEDKNDLAPEELTKVLWYLNRVPLIVKYDSRKEERIRAAVELLATETTRKKLVLVGLKSEETFLNNWKIFDSLHDLRNETLYKEIIATFKITLHKRPSISLETFIDSDTEIAKFIDTKDLFLMLEDHNIGKPLMRLPQHYIPRTLTCDNISVEEAEAISVFDNPVNFVIGLPGIGKSTLMTFLSHHCPSRYWCIRITLIKYVTFLSMEHTTEDILDVFLKEEDTFFKKMKSTFRKYKRIYLLLDGLDEISDECIETVLDFVKNISSTGIRVWISSREHLENRISKKFEISPIKIQELTRRNQEEYIKKRLYDRSEEEANRIINGLFTSVDVSYIVKNLLGVPLLLFIITEIFRDDDKISKEDIFVLSKMYRRFFQIKEKHQYKNPQKEHISISIYLDKILEMYEFSALEASAPQFLRELEIDRRRITENQKFLTKIRNEGDPLEIITQVVGGKDQLRAIFAHQSFAEYFACVWLKKNQEKLVLIKDFFMKRYNENLRLIFDIMLAEDNPLHLAVLYKNLEHVEKQYNKHQQEKDEGGRSVLHLISSYCEKNSEYIEASLRENEDRVTIDFKILQILSQSCDPFEVDILFTWNCFDYASSRNSLLVFEVLLETYQESFILDNLIKQFRGLKGLVECCCFRGYSTLFKILLHKFLEDVKKLKNLMYLLIRGSKDVTEICFKQKYLEIIKILLDCGYDIHNTLDSENTLYNTLELSCKSGNYTMVETLLEHNNQRNQKLLHLALTNGNTDVIELLLEKGCNINATNQNQWTLLHYACYYGRYNACRKILELGSDLNALTNKKQTPLHLALESGKSEIIELLLKEGCNVNLANVNGWTPLHYACHFGTCHSVIKILESGGDINAVTDNKQTMLHLALENRNDDDIIKILLMKGLCNVNLGNVNEWTPLHYACCLGKFKIVFVMLQLGGDLNAVTSEKQTLLHLAAESGNVDIIKLLLKKGCKINVTDDNEWTPLHYACRYGKVGAVTTILELGGDVNCVTNEKITLLHLGAESGDIDTIELLVKKGCNINVTDDHKLTPLHYACRYGTYDAVIKILELGGDVTLVTDKKQSPLHLASVNGKIDIIELLVKNGCGINITDEENGLTPLHYACINMNLNAVKTILELGGDLNAVTDKEQSPLHLAIETRTTSIIKYLLKKGLNTALAIENKLIPLNYGKFDAFVKLSSEDDTLTPLHLASISANSNAIELLSKKGYDINVTDDNKWSPLHYACRYGTYDAVIKILELGGDLNAVTDKRQTPLHLASMNKSFDRRNIVNYLLNNGIDMNASDVNDWSCLKYACGNGNYDIVEVLLGDGACLDSESRDFLIQNVYGLIREGRVQLIDLLLQLGKIEEIEASLTHVPLEFPICLVKRGGVLQPNLLLKMVKLIREYYMDHSFGDDLRNLGEFLIENFDSVDA